MIPSGRLNGYSVNTLRDVLVSSADADSTRQLNHTKPAMRYSAALGSRLMARILEGEERVRVSRLVTLRQD